MHSPQNLWTRRLRGWLWLTMVLFGMIVAAVTDRLLPRVMGRRVDRR